MSTTDLLKTLCRLEQELHSLETRRNTTRLEQLLHTDFMEIGRSGQTYSRAQILVEFADVESYPNILSESFRLSLLTASTALLTYTSYHVHDSGNRDTKTLRSSIWLCESNEWRLRFHQGTPADD